MSTEVVHEVTKVLRTRRRPNVMFPIILYDVLCDEDPMLITWLPCGTMFEIKNVQLFKEQVIPRHFTCKLESQF